LEFEDAWLEVEACADRTQAADAERMLEVPAISEVLEAASANRHPGMWNYSRRLDAAETELIQSTLRFTRTFEDSRSISHSADVAYKGSCYTLTLFTVKKRNQ
jgi:hypothetical protein